MCFLLQPLGAFLSHSSGGAQASHLGTMSRQGLCCSCVTWGQAPGRELVSWETIWETPNMEAKAEAGLQGLGTGRAMPDHIRGAGSPWPWAPALGGPLQLRGGLDRRRSSCTGDPERPHNCSQRTSHSYATPIAKQATAPGVPCDAAGHSDATRCVSHVACRNLLINAIPHSAATRFI